MERSMKVAFLSAKSYEESFFLEEIKRHSYKLELEFFEHRLSPQTAPLVLDYSVICIFVHDDASRETIEVLRRGKTRVIALRCAGFNNVDLRAAEEAGIQVCNVPAYSPNAVAEHTVGMMLTLNRKFHRSYWRVREGNFSLDGLMGFDMAGKTIGIIGTGKIGSAVARILLGMQCTVLAVDPVPSEECRKMGVEYVTLEHLLQRSDVITLHCPLTPETYHLINAERIAMMKDGAMLINTSRGAVVDTKALIQALKRRKFCAVGLDVYEEEEKYFYEDLSDKVIEDDLLARLLTFPNVLITAHQAFFTREALENIARTTLANIVSYMQTGVCTNLIRSERYKTQPVKR